MIPLMKGSSTTWVGRLADRILDDAKLSPGMILADVGAGEGLLAFRAIERVGPMLQVVLTDISGPMLRHAEALAVQRGKNLTTDRIVYLNAKRPAA
jgi:ubiquinone/menaquinone biosynthesis C-methylase UbiE